MHGHDIYFDLTDNKIGFSESDCKHPFIDQGRFWYFGNDNERKHEAILITLCILLSFALILFLVGYYRVKSGQSFLWIKATDQCKNYI
jgi:hypothetical protein